MAKGLKPNTQPGPTTVHPSSYERRVMGSMTFSRRRKTVGQSGWREELRETDKGARNCVRVRGVTFNFDDDEIAVGELLGKNRKVGPAKYMDENGVNIFARPTM